MPSKTRIATRSFGFVTMLAAGLTVLPISPLAALTGEDTARAQTFDPPTQVEFETTFAALPPVATEVAVPDHAVELDSFEPPVEAEAVPAKRSLGSGVASYYGRKFHGRRTANGERFDMHGLTAAHKTLPFGTRVLVTNPFERQDRDRAHQRSRAVHPGPLDRPQPRRGRAHRPRRARARPGGAFPPLIPLIRPC